MPDGKKEVRAKTDELGSPPRAHVDWFEKDDRRMAVVTTNKDHPETGQYASQMFLRDSADTLKSQKGWDYGTYDFVTSTDRGFEEVGWGVDPTTKNPIFDQGATPITEQRMYDRIESFGLGKDMDDYLEKSFDRYSMKPEFDLD